MNWRDFHERYPDEESCKAEWKRYREAVGVVCPNCGGTAHYWKRDKESFECKNCHYRQSLRANTVMHGSRLPFMYWFTAIQMMTTTKKTVSALEVQRQLRHKNYVPIWAMLHKLRAAMGKRDALYKLDGLIEMTESSFTVELSAAARQQLQQQNKTDSQDGQNAKVEEDDGKIRRTAKVLVLAETHERTDFSRPLKATDKPTAVKYVKMFVVENLEPEEISDVAVKSVHNRLQISPVKPLIHKELQSIVRACLRGLFNKGMKVDNSDIAAANDLTDDNATEKTKKAPPWVHIAVKNAKRVIDGIFHDITPEYLQNYLNEFCYKFNRRDFGETLFNRLLIAGVSYKNHFRY